MGWPAKVARWTNGWVERATGMRFVRSSGPLPPDIDKVTAEIIKTVAPFTMVSPQRIDAVCRAIDYVEAGGVPGAVVECGVWKGGAVMAAMLRLLRTSGASRDVWLYDSFEGMPEAGPQDIDLDGNAANDIRQKRIAKGQRWAYAELDEVRTNVASTGYPADRVTFVVGRVEDTIPGQVPDRIAMLRLDTDWYKSTRHELEHLIPRMSPGGVLIVDDYGHWAGSRQAVDEYFADRPVLLTRTDYSGRMAIIP